MLDVVGFFGSLEAVLGKPLTPADRNYTELITQHLVTFARTGELGPIRVGGPVTWTSGPFCFLAAVPQVAANEESERLYIASLVSISYNALIMATLPLHLLLVPPSSTP